MNNLRTLLLMLGLTALMLLLGDLMGGKSGLVMGLGFAVVSNFFAYFFSDKIVLMLYGAKPANESEHPLLFKTVRDLAAAAKMPLPKIYIIQANYANAFATGRNPSHAAVAVTTAIMEVLSERELRGVLAHELSHVRHRDILISSIAAIIAGAIYTIARIAQWGLYFGGGSRDDNRRGGNPIALLAVVIVAPLAAMIIQMAISRSREYEADRGGADLSQDPLALAEALKKIHQAARAIPGSINPTTAHLFIVNPLKGESILSLFSTHPPLKERVARLEAIAEALVQRPPSLKTPKIIY